jgi:hypothetical protein
MCVAVAVAGTTPGSDARGGVVTSCTVCFAEGMPPRIRLLRMRPPAARASLAALTPSAMLLVAICTPKQRSFGALYSLARSTRSPLCVDDEVV